MKYSDDIDGHDKIVKVVELAMKGAAEGNRAYLKEAFHDKAQMFGEAKGIRFDEPIEEFFKLCEAYPLGTPIHEKNVYRSRVVSVTRVGGAAMVMVTEDGCWGSVSFVDFFTVTEIAGQWKITNKTFAYTGGVIPPVIVP
jgi:hypothetical protein